MNRARLGLIFMVLGLFVVHSCSLTLTEVERYVDLQTQTVRVAVDINYKASGEKNFFYTLDSEFYEKLHFLEVLVSGTDKALSHEWVDESNCGTYGCQKIEKLESDMDAHVLAINIENNEEQHFQIYLFFSDAIEMYPKVVKQDENQMVKFSESHFFLTPYKTVKQKTVVVLNSPFVESYTDVDDPDLVKCEEHGSMITFGPYMDIPSNSWSNMKLHFLSTAKYLVSEEAMTTIRISHFGYVAVKEEVQVQNAGPKMVGKFSRWDYFARSNYPQSYSKGQGPMMDVRELEARIPKAAADLYYRDTIGNISTSEIVHEKDEIVFKLVPRFPLLGGWKTKFEFGFNLPLKGFLYMHKKYGGYYIFKYRVGSAVSDLAINKQVVKIMLPEGATDIQVHARVNFTEERSVGKSYLDFFGRPVVTITTENLIPKLSEEEYTITYAYSWLNMLRKPIVIFYFILAMFFVFFVISKVKLSLGTWDTTHRKDE